MIVVCPDDAGWAAALFPKAASTSILQALRKHLGMPWVANPLADRLAAAYAADLALCS